ncbi:MAG: thioredoxin domain-containing protein [Candidatus Babeliales bacterium]
MKLKILLVCFCTLLLGCASKEEDTKEKVQFLIDLNASTNIILTLIEQKRVDEIFDGVERDKAQWLIKNFSPAQIAFHAEALSFDGPLVVLFYETKDSDLFLLLACLEEKARKWHDRARFAIIDAQELSKLAYEHEVKIFPTIVLIKNQEEYERWEGQEQMKCALDILDDKLAYFVV